MGAGAGKESSSAISPALLLPDAVRGSPEAKGTEHRLTARRRRLDASPLGNPQATGEGLSPRIHRVNHDCELPRETRKHKAALRE